MVTDPAAPHLILTKNGRKYIVACARPSDMALTQTRDLARLHMAVVDANADAGFYITSRAFIRVMEQTQRFVYAIDFSDLPRSRQFLSEHYAFKDPDDNIKLRMPDDVLAVPPA